MPQLECESNVKSRRRPKASRRRRCTRSWRFPALEGEGGRFDPATSPSRQATPTAVSQTLKSLEEKGLITRQRDKGDSRAVTVHLTEDGRAFSARGRELHEQMIDEVLTYLGPEDAEHLVRIVERLVDLPACKAVRAQQNGCAQAGCPVASAGASPASTADAGQAGAASSHAVGTAMDAGAAFSAADVSSQTASAEGGHPCA